MIIEKNVLKKVLISLLIVVLSLALFACMQETVTITFANTNLSAIELDKGTKLTKPTDPEKSGYIFADWYEDEEFKVLFSFDKEINKNTTIYALFYASISQLKVEGAELEHDTLSQEHYYVKATIKNISNLEWGNMTITDGKDDIGIYGLYREDGEKFSEIENKPIVGDVIYIYGPLKKYHEEIELNGAFLIKFEEGNKEDIDLSNYEVVSINDARAKEVNAKVLVTGVVANITYANGRKPNGVYLFDNTDSIYVYSNDIATSVKVGDKIEVAAERANFILETEMALAKEHGYEGAIQLDNAHLINKISENNEIDLSWTKEKTIKEIMDTNHRVENLTSTTFKVKAFINKREGTGFINYYFNDLDNMTGSYVYSMNNGSDFDWLDKYDGELRIVYLSVINAKATASGIVYRFIPIAIGDIYEYDQSYNTEFAIKYFALDQFEESYTEGFSPDKEMITNVVAEHLGIANVKLTYSSSNEESVYFEEVGDKLILKTDKRGSAEITIRAIDGAYTYEGKVTIDVVEPPKVTTITVDEAIKSADDTKVTVKGIVAASIVNKVGFYLVDETGLIAIQMTAEALKGIELGNEVIIEGIKTHIGGSDSAVGQIVIDKAEVLINYKGNHEYSTASFKTGKTLEDFMDLDKLVDYSTEVYVFEATIFYEETPFFTRYQIRDGDLQMNIYSSSGSQLGFLTPFQNQKVTIEFTVVNWNGKGWSGSIISVTDGTTKAVSDQNFR